MRSCHRAGEDFGFSFLNWKSSVPDRWGDPIPAPLHHQPPVFLSYTAPGHPLRTKHILAPSVTFCPHKCNLIPHNFPGSLHFKVVVIEYWKTYFVSYSRNYRTRRKREKKILSSKWDLWDWVICKEWKLTSSLFWSLDSLRSRLWHPVKTFLLPNSKAEDKRANNKKSPNSAFYARSNPTRRQPHLPCKLIATLMFQLTHQISAGIWKGTFRLL